MVTLEDGSTDDLHVALARDGAGERLRRMRLLILCLVILTALGVPAASGEPASAASPKINPLLAQTLERIRDSGVTRERMEAYSLEQYSTSTVRVDRQGRVQVYLDVESVDDATLRELQAAGMTVELASPKYRIVQGWIPFDRVDRVAGLPGVKHIRPPDYAVPRSRSQQRPHPR